MRLGKERIEGKRGFAGASWARQHDQRIVWNLKGQIFEIVLTRAFDEERRALTGQRGGHERILVLHAIKRSRP